MERSKNWNAFQKIGKLAPPDLMFRNVYLIANSFEEFPGCLETYEVD